MNANTKHVIARLLVFMTVFELLVAVLQAYIFTVLTIGIHTFDKTCNNFVI